MTTQIRKHRFPAQYRFEAGKLVYRAFGAAPKSLDAEARTIEFTASTETVDRMGDVIRVAGWDLANFNKNPVFLFSHRSEDPPIGKIVNSVKQGGKNPALIQTAQFATKDVYPFADTIYKMYAGGFMSATSVGFMPKLSQPMFSPDEDGGEFLGYEFLEQELFELSAVPVPANPEALGRILRGAMTGEKFDGTKLGELFLRDAVERSVIGSEEADAMHKFICGDKNPPWAYSLSGVTFSEETVDESNKSIPLGEWKEASSQCVKRAERIVERVERTILSLEETATKLAAANQAITSEMVKAAVREVLKEQAVVVVDTKGVEEVPAEVKTLGDAHGLMVSAHKDMSRAHGKTALAIGHIAAHMAANPDETDPDEQEPDADPDDQYYSLAAGVEKAVVPFAAEPLADAGTKWDAGKEMNSTDKPEDWKKMSTVYEGDAALKGSYKLPHHLGPEGGFKTVKAGVQNALARLDQTDMPEADRAGAKAHLEKHMAEFEKQEASAEPDVLAGIGIDTTPETSVLEDLGIIQPETEKAASEPVSGEIPPAATVPQNETDSVEALLKALD